MIPKECKRLAEVDFPIAVVSRHAAQEKKIRHGHPSTLHLWWARRPLAACRAMLMGLLLPDPKDPQCPAEFKIKAKQLLPQLQGRVPNSDAELRAALLKFIGDFADWVNANNRSYLEIGRALIKAAHDEDPPLVVDPFAGGGAIPLEALRLGCEAFASDLNPVACLINKVMLEDIPRHGSELADELRKVGVSVKKAAEQQLAEYYPLDEDGSRPITYLWARTVQCESPNCGAEIPLVRSFWLCKKDKRRRALRPLMATDATGSTVKFELFEPRTEKDIPTGTVSRAKATCLFCQAVLPPERVRAQLHAQKGGADVVFDDNGIRIGGACLLAVVTLNAQNAGRHYRLGKSSDYRAVWKAQKRLTEISAVASSGELSPIPDEPINPVRPSPNARGLSAVTRYGVSTFGDMFSRRQCLAVYTLARHIASSQSIAKRLATFALSKTADLSNTLCRWEPVAECPRQLFTRHAAAMTWDFAEGVPLSSASGGFEVCLENTINGLASIRSIDNTATVIQCDAARLALPDGSVSLLFTDPPYYDAIPYADLSDFFYVWLKRCGLGSALGIDKDDDLNLLTPKTHECVWNQGHTYNGKKKDSLFFEDYIATVFAKARRVLNESGICSVVFAHSTTEGWESLLNGLIKGGWTVTCSWPVATEMASRMRARNTAALATSVHLVCRPRADDAPVGDWTQVIRELPKRVAEWIERLQSEGVRGADLVFACIGPALEIYSRYSKVVDAQDREIPLGGDPEATNPHERGYLAAVWETVGRAALEQVLGRAGSSAGALEEDARLTALFLWTLQATEGEVEETQPDDTDADDPDEFEDEEENGGGRKKGGFSLVYDVARRFAQPLGIHLEEWENRIIETKKGTVRLLPVSERAEKLFGKDGAEAVADRLDAGPKKAASNQMTLFDILGEVGEDPTPKKGWKGKKAAGVTDDARRSKREATTLDRVHAAMLLQSSGRTNALRTLLKDEVARGGEFLRLANALSALYPQGCEEKRLVDAMLLAVPR